MKKAAVVYWSGTGNTERMAQEIVAGLQEAGAQASLFTAAEFDPSTLSEYDALAFGCPSMGAEELEEEEFAPMFRACEPALAGRRIALFGSYGWGDGEWVRLWEEQCRQDGALLACESVICNEAPDDDALAALRALAAELAS